MRTAQAGGWNPCRVRIAPNHSRAASSSARFGVASSPVVEGKFLYITDNRNELLCLDTKGQADGNDGPYVNEGRYMAGWGELPNKPGRFDPQELHETAARGQDPAHRRRHP